jgi:hypothetical protein
LICTLAGQDGWHVLGSCNSWGDRKLWSWEALLHLKFCISFCCHYLLHALLFLHHTGVSARKWGLMKTIWLGHHWCVFRGKHCAGAWTLAESLPDQDQAKPIDFLGKSNHWIAFTQITWPLLHEKGICINRGCERFKGVPINKTCPYFCGCLL